MWNTPVVFDPSNLDTIDPATDTDFAKAALNFRVPMLREASMRPFFFNASTQVSAGSQQFINLGPYVVSKRSNIAAAVIIV
jgi:hypothetical protein